MQYKAFKDIQLSRLGMGNMRLPSTNPKDPNALIDTVAAHEIIDHAYESGITHFDTAYVYGPNGDSDKCVGACMKKHDRDSFYLATKFFINANPDYKAVFEEQLERLQTDHIDFYLIHCLMDGNVDTYLNSGAIEYFMDLKKQGKIRYLGFSTHASVASLNKFLDHHDWDFVQIQLNYYDWLYGTAKAEYEAIALRNIPIMVMEPVRGGRLASLTPEAETILKAVHPDWTTASWAIRFAMSLPMVQVVLSGMSTMDQLNNNLKTAEEFTALTEEETAVLFKACEFFKNQIQVPCTGCRYCTGECPMEINIPAYLSLYNTYKVDGRGALRGASKIESVGKPQDCIGCGACMGHCPQSIDTPSIMTELSELLK